MATTTGGLTRINWKAQIRRTVTPGKASPTLGVAPVKRPFAEAFAEFSRRWRDLENSPC